MCLYIGGILHWPMRPLRHRLSGLSTYELKGHDRLRSGGARPAFPLVYYCSVLMLNGGVLLYRGFGCEGFCRTLASPTPDLGFPAASTAAAAATTLLSSASL